MKRSFMAGAVLVALASGLAACTNPYDPGQRALGGAAIGAIAGGGRGAAIGALAGGAVGAATTPQPPPGYYAQPPGPGYYTAPPPPGYYAPGPGYYYYRY